MESVAVRTKVRVRELLLVWAIISAVIFLLEQIGDLPQPWGAFAVIQILHPTLLQTHVRFNPWFSAAFVVLGLAILVRAYS